MKKSIIAMSVLGLAMLNLFLVDYDNPKKSLLSLYNISNANADSGESCASTEYFYFDNVNTFVITQAYCIDSNWKICGLEVTCNYSSNPNDDDVCTSTVCD